MTSQTVKRLMPALKRFYNNRDFVCGTICNCRDEEGRKILLDFIEEAERRGDKHSSDDILLLSVIIGRQRTAAKQAAEVTVM